MKILSEFLRLRAVGARFLRGGSKPVRRAITITVPRPLVEASPNEPVSIDRHRPVLGGDSRVHAPWQPHEAAA